MALPTGTEGGLWFSCACRAGALLCIAFGIPAVQSAEETSLSAPEETVGTASRPVIAISLSAPPVIVESTRVIAQDEAHYLGWPSLALRKNGELVLAYSGGRDYHVCPFGRIEWMTSRDEGKTWSAPRILLDTALDDRGPSVLETAKGTLLLGCIASTVYQRHMNHPEKLLNKVFGGKVGEHLDRWRTADQKTTPEQKKQIAGPYDGRMLLRSADGGETWSAPMPVPFFTPRGAVVLSDGTLFCVAGDGKTAGAWLSRDDGLNWERLSRLPTTAGESHCVEAADGSVMAHVREKQAVAGGRIQYTTQTKSRDGGKTWSTPQKVAEGYPSQLLCLEDGMLLMTYGVRKKPFGIGGRISKDNGNSWSEEFRISEDGATWDLGYPCTVQLRNGRLATVWYEVPAGKKNAVIRQAVWRME